jgi:hypothetical protein
MCCGGNVGPVCYCLRQCFGDGGPAGCSTVEWRREVKKGQKKVKFRKDHFRKCLKKKKNKKEDQGRSSKEKVRKMSDHTRS